MWIAIKEFGTGEQLLINTLSGMRIHLCNSPENMCIVMTAGAPGFVTRIQAEFERLVLSLQALDLRQ